METIYETKVGKVHVKVTAEPDYDFGYDMLKDTGRFTDERNAKTNKPLYYIREDLVRLPNSDIWRDRRGRIAKAPDFEAIAYYSRNEYAFIQIEDWYEETLKIAFSVADRVQAYESGDWCYLSIVARAYVAGVKVSTAALGGVESDSEASYILSCARDMARESTNGVREWRKEVAA